jgi:guanylate kinase
VDCKGPQRAIATGGSGQFGNGGVRMKLMILFGDAAVGKMTVGQELMKITDFRLYHNHMSI